MEGSFFINLLCKAVTVVVTVVLIVRSMCCLIAEQEIICERIFVKRFVGKYFKFTVLFNFWADEYVLVALGFADFPIINLKTKIGVSINIMDEKRRLQSIYNYLLQCQDNTKSSRIKTYNEQLRHQVSGVVHNAQNDIFNYLKKISC